MSDPRQILPNATYLVTRRCIGRRFLLRPDDTFNNAFTYCLARAAEKYGVRIHAYCVMSNHYHLVVTDSEGVLPDFAAWLNRQLAMCVKRLRGWHEVVWEPGRTYSAVQLGGTAEIFDKIAYTLLNPVSAALVRSPERWPGEVSTLATLRSGRVTATRPSVWFRADAPGEVTLELTAAPGSHDRSSFFDSLESLLESRQAHLRHELRREGRGFVGRSRIRKTQVTAHPSSVKPRLGVNPTFSALTRAAWRAAAQRLRRFRLAYRHAYNAWRMGRGDVEFPAGTWWVVRYAGAAVVT